MSKKNFHSDGHQPPMVTYYRNAHKAVFGKSPFVHENLHSKFLVLSDDLRENDIPPLDYAYTVVALLKMWAVNKKLTYIPVNVFCGKYAYDKFMKIYESYTVDISIGCDEEVLYSELLVARLYIERNKSSDVQCNFYDIVNELKPMLSEIWLELYSGNKKGGRPVSKVLEILSNEYNVELVNNYDELVRYIKNG